MTVVCDYCTKKTSGRLGRFNLVVGYILNQF